MKESIYYTVTLFLIYFSKTNSYIAIILVGWAVKHSSTLCKYMRSISCVFLQPEIGAISGSSNGEMRMWSLISGESDRFSSKHSASIVAIVFTLSCIASLDIAEMLCIWDLNTRRCLYRWSRTHVSRLYIQCICIVSNLFKLQFH